MQRKSMNEALAPEAVAFLKGKEPENKQEKLKITTKEKPSSSIKSQKKVDTKKNSSQKLVPTNFRLPAEVFNGIIKASALRKIEGKYPFKQKDIVAEAVSEWLNKNKV